MPLVELRSTYLVIVTGIKVQRHKINASIAFGIRPVLLFKPKETPNSPPEKFSRHNKSSEVIRECEHGT